MVLKNAVDDVGVTSDPADIGRTPVHVVMSGPQVEDVATGQEGVGKVAAGGMHDALGLAGAARRVEQEEHVLAVHLLAWTLVGHVLGEFVPPMISAGLHLDVVAASLQDNDVGDPVGHRHRLIDVGLEWNHLAPPPGSVTGDADLRIGVFDPVCNGLWGEAAKDHAVRRADAGAGQHGNRQFGNHAHIDGHHIAAFDTTFLEDVRKAAHFVLEIAIGQLANLGAVLEHRLTFPDDCRFVAIAEIDDAIDTIVTGIDLATREPPRVRAVPFQHGVPLLEPVKFVGNRRPEVLAVLETLAVEFVIHLHRVHPRAAHAVLKVCRWLEYPLFVQNRFDI